MISTETPWYDLFSRGARDWLRHNEKVREAIQQNLPNLALGSDVITGSQERTVQIPVRLLEHVRFQLADDMPPLYVGQGQGKEGDILSPTLPDIDDETEQGRNSDGEVKLLLEFKIDDIIDWLWEEMQLPDLQPKRHARLQNEDLIREGWDKHGARARLDRRRTVKEAVKRRSIQQNPVPFTNEDLRFRQLVPRRSFATNAVVIFTLDVSASMTGTERKLAKNFFFFVLQGIRRRYAKVETRFIAHTTQAWEFSESEFFHVTGSGGTGASTAFRLALELIQREYDPAQYNAYLFYASDGENFTEDHPAAMEYLTKLTSLLNYIGYVETVPGAVRSSETEMTMLCAELERNGAPIGSSVLTRSEDVWKAIRKFFMQQKTK